MLRPDCHEERYITRGKKIHSYVLQAFTSSDRLKFARERQSFFLCLPTKMEWEKSYVKFCTRSDYAIVPESTSENDDENRNLRSEQQNVKICNITSCILRVCTRIEKQKKKKWYNGKCFNWVCESLDEHKLTCINLYSPSHVLRARRC